MFPKIGVPPKWMVKIMENPLKMDDLGGPPLVLVQHPNDHINKSMLKAISKAIVSVENFQALASTELPVAEVVDTGALSFLTSALRSKGGRWERWDSKKKTWKTPGEKSGF